MVLPDFWSNPRVSAVSHPVIGVGGIGVAVGVRVTVGGTVAVGGIVAVGVCEGVYVNCSVCVMVGVKEGV